MLRTRNKTRSEYRNSGSQRVPSDPLRGGLRVGGQGESAVGGASSKTEIRVRSERGVHGRELVGESAVSPRDGKEQICLG